MGDELDLNDTMSTPDEGSSSVPSESPEPEVESTDRFGVMRLLGMADGGTPLPGADRNPEAVDMVKEDLQRTSGLLEATVPSSDEVAQPDPNPDPDATPNPVPTPDPDPTVDRSLDGGVDTGTAAPTSEIDDGYDPYAASSDSFDSPSVSDDDFADYGSTDGGY